MILSVNSDKLLENYKNPQCRKNWEGQGKIKKNEEVTEFRRKTGFFLKWLNFFLIGGLVYKMF